MKIGRNDMCHCGSGKKYKKCHLDTDKDIPEVIELFKKEEQKKAVLRQMGIYMNYVKPIIFNNAKVWAIGNKVYAGRNPNETFHEFIIFIFKETIGLNWITEQYEKKEKEQHFLIKCLKNYELFLRDNSRDLKIDKKGLLIKKPNGWVKSLITLAFDVATLRHENNLPETLISRLKNYNEYQGARYEIMIAAIFARLGFELDWIYKTKDGKKHCEFIAKDKENNIEVAVEVKSRHRSGVLHTVGTDKGIQNLKGDINGLINKAFQKEEYGKMPYIIFIDMNAPYYEDKDFTKIPWIKDIFKNFVKKNGSSENNPADYNAVYFTNFSHHYVEDKDPVPGQNLQSVPQFQSNPISNRRLYNALSNALQHYGEIPDINIDD